MNEINNIEKTQENIFKPEVDCTKIYLLEMLVNENIDKSNDQEEEDWEYILWLA